METYSYVYTGGRLTQETVTTVTTADEGTETTTDTLDYTYGVNGPASVNWNGTEYYYLTNAQGDIVALLDESGNFVVQYSYDAWGNPLSTTGSMADTLGSRNSLRYRGYVFDDETGLYYLQSRYYDPEICRFINADTYAATGQGFLGNNMFAYCLNNPAMYVDSTGSFAAAAAAVAIIAAGGIVGGLLGAFTASTTGGDVFESAIEGIITGTIGSACGVFIPNGFAAVVVSAFGGAVTDFGVQATSQCIRNNRFSIENIDTGRIFKTAVENGIGTALPKFGAGHKEAVDAFGTALLWAEGSTLIACTDVAITKFFNPAKPRSTVLAVPSHGGNIGRANGFSAYSKVHYMRYN